MGAMVNEISPLGRADLLAALLTLISVVASLFLFGEIARLRRARDGLQLFVDAVGEGATTLLPSVREVLPLARSIWRFVLVDDWLNHIWVAVVVAAAAFGSWLSLVGPFREKGSDPIEWRYEPDLVSWGFVSAFTVLVAAILVAWGAQLLRTQRFVRDRAKGLAGLDPRSGAFAAASKVLEPLGMDRCRWFIGQARRRRRYTVTGEYQGRKEVVTFDEDMDASGADRVLVAARGDEAVLLVSGDELEEMAGRSLSEEEIRKIVQTVDSMQGRGHYTSSDLRSLLEGIVGIVLDQ